MSRYCARTFSPTILRNNIFTHNVGKSNQDYEFNCRLYFNNDDEIFREKSELCILNELFVEFNLKKGWTKLEFCYIGDAESWIDLYEQVLFTSVKKLID